MKVNAEARLFLIVAFICGLLLVFLTAPLNAPDEKFHFFQAYGVSKGKFSPEELDGQRGIIVPEAVVSFASIYPDKTIYDTDHKISYTEMKKAGTDKIENGRNVVYTEVTSPVGYLFSGLGMAVGSVVGKFPQPYNIMCYGRIGNLFFYIAVIFLALCLTPAFRKTMLLLALMPMSLFLAASLSYDAVIIPVAFLFVSLVMKMIKCKEKTVSGGEIAGVMVCAFFMAGIKMAYLPLLLLLIAVPKAKYGSTKRMIICIALTLLAVLAGHPSFITDIKASLTAPVAAGANVQPSPSDLQQNWLREHLDRIPHIIVNTFRDHFFGYAIGFWGVLGWLDTYLPIPFTVMGLMVVLLMALLETMSSDPSALLRGWKRVLPLVGIAVSFGGMLYVMYIEHTSLDVVAGIGKESVEGIQGRYLIPLFLPFWLMFANGVLLRFKPFREDGCVQRAVGFFARVWAVCCGVFTVVFVLLRYWI